MSEEELEFDHFKNIDELLEHIKIWYQEEDIYYDRWFGLNDLYKLSNYITNLQQENKQLKAKSEVLEENNKLLIQQKAQMYEDLDFAYKKIDKAIDKLYCYGEVFDSKILQQFQREMIEILGDNEQEKYTLTPDENGTTNINGVLYRVDKK